jgi:serine/threonine-protein kinase RsbW
MQRSQDLTRNAEVRLAVPAAPQFVRLVRLAAADIATRAGFSLDEIDDLRMAVDELCFALTGVDGCAGELAVTFWLAGDEVVVEGVGRFAIPGPPPDGNPQTAIRSQILSSVLDEHRIDPAGTPPSFWGRKRRAAA